MKTWPKDVSSRKHLPVVGLGFLVTILCCLCAWFAPSHRPVTLMDSIHSGQRPEQMRQILKIKPDDWEMGYNYYHRSKRDGKHNNLMFAVGDYSHLGVQGWLKAEFFNERLMRIYFTPMRSTDYVQYKKRLGKTMGVDFDQKKRIKIDGARIYPVDTVKGVYWEDIALVRSESMSRW